MNDQQIQGEWARLVQAEKKAEQELKSVTEKWKKTFNRKVEFAQEHGIEWIVPSPF